MLTLLASPPALGLPSSSPFGMKAMALLALSGLPWSPDFTADRNAMPKGKLPVLRDGETLIPDSEDIRKHLERASARDFDAGLDAGARATARLIQRMCDEHLYFALVHDRWARDEVWPTIREAFFARIPEPKRAEIAEGARATVIRNLWGQGLGRHSPEEIAARAAEDLTAIETLLGTRPWLFGETPTAADCSAAAIILALSANPQPTPIRRFIESRPALAAYAARFRATLLPG